MMMMWRARAEPPSRRRNRTVPRPRRRTLTRNIGGCLWRWGCSNYGFSDVGATDAHVTCRRRWHLLSASADSNNGSTGSGEPGQGRTPTRRRRENIMVEDTADSRLMVLVMLSWLPYFIYPHERLYRAPANFGAVQILPGDKMILPVQINLSDFIGEYADNYRAVVVAFHYNGGLDASDTQGLQKSAPHDVRYGDDVFQIPVDDEFRNQIRNGVKGTNYVIVFLPKSVSPDQFKTLHEAEALGAHILQIGAGPP